MLCALHNFQKTNTGKLLHVKIGQKLINAYSLKFALNSTILDTHS